MRGWLRRPAALQPVSILIPVIYVLLLVVSCAIPIQAQTGAFDASKTDSLRRAAQAAGRAAAESVHVSDLFVPALLGAMSVGAAGALLKADSEKKVAPALLAGVGAAVIATTLGSVSRNPVSTTTGEATHERFEYLAQFDAAFAARLGQRRRKAILLGSLSGAILGTAAMHLLLAQWLST